MSNQRFVFVLRLWPESPAGGVDLRPRLRGSLQRVDSEHVYYFESFDRLPEILRRVMAGQAGSEGKGGQTEGKTTL